MEKCAICYKKIKAQQIKKCCKCNIGLCDECSYYSRFNMLIKEAGLPDNETNEIHYFCESHFIELLEGFSGEFLEDLQRKNFLLHYNINENKQEINYIREFKGKNLQKIVFKAIPEWPSDEWKDWNTM